MTDWSKAVSARLEGRPAVIGLGLAFCGMVFWLGIRDYEAHPLLSVWFLTAAFVVATLIMVVGLLVKPQPSEVAERYIGQQIGQQFFFAGGLQSAMEMVQVLRETQNIQDLPTPSAVVEGSAADEANYREISQEEGQTLVRQDHEAVNKMLLEEIQGAAGGPITKEKLRIVAAASNSASVPQDENDLKNRNTNANERQP